MALNESIELKIDALNLKESEKRLLKDMLLCQEHVSKQYTKQYLEVINKYLEKKK